MVIPYADNLRVGFFFHPMVICLEKKTVYGRVGGWMDFYSSGPIIQETTSLEQKVTQNQSLLLKKKYSVEINTLAMVTPTIGSL